MKIIPQPWQLLFRICGISPLGNQKDKLFTGLFLVILSSHYAVILISQDKVPYNMRLIISSVYWVTTLIFLAYNYWCPERLLKLDRELKQVGRDLNNLCGITIDTSTVRKPIIVWSIVFGLLLPIVNSFNLPLHVVARVWVSHLLLLMPLLQEILLANLVNNRFSVLNERLAGTVVGSDTPALLDSVFRIHSCLHFVVAEINLHYSFYNLLTFTAMFITWIQQMYTILLSISGGTTEFFFYIFLFRMQLSTSYFILQVIVCHSCSQEGNRTVMIAHRLLQLDTDPSIWEQVRVFSVLATDNKVKFTIGGIFSLDLTLVTKTALTALSYLIIAIQLRDVVIFGGGEKASSTTVIPSTLFKQRSRSFH